MNPEENGVAWERPVSAELLFSDGTNGFQIDAGIRIQGGSSTRDWKSAKLSMRLLFKTDYGASKLKYPLFPDSPVAKFDTVILDAHLNFTWVHPDHNQRIRSEYVRDQFVSDLQNAAGSLAPRGRYVHLFLNRLYWGVYHVHERPDHSFAAQHLGGDKTEYDVLKNRGAQLVEGTADIWNQMTMIARSGLEEDARYQEIQKYLDIDDLIDYMVINFYVGNDDWPHNNWYATRRRVAGAGFRFHSWDAEHILKDVNIDRTGVDDNDCSAELFQALRDNADFRARLAARVGELFAPSGVLGGTNPAELYRRRADQFEPAVVLESARWGDNRRADEPYTRDDWIAARDWLLDEYFPKRAAIVKAQLTP
jgi:spore coat protein CotH